MGKALKTAGVIIGAAALIATGVGALAMPGLAGSTTLFGISTGTLNTISSGLIAVGGMLDKPKSQGSAQPDEWTSNPDQPIPFLFGRMGVAGKIVQRDEFGPDNMYQGIVGIISGAGPIKGIQSFKGDDQAVTFGANGIAVSSQWQGEMWMVRRSGAQPDTVLTVPAGLKSGGQSFEWSSSAKLSGKACYLQVLGENSKGSAYPAGIPDPVHVGEGIYGYDPRYDSTYPGGEGSCRFGVRSTYRYIEDPIIAGLNWALGMVENGQVVGGVGASVDGIDIPAFVEAANISEANGWKVAAWPDTSEDVSSVLDQFLQAGGAVRARHAGKISCVSRGAPRASVVTVTARDLAGSIELNTAPSLFDQLNTITPRFMSEAGGWKLTPANPVSFAAYVTEDGGKHGDQIDYRFCPLLKQAAELAAYDILDAREPFSGSVPLKPHMRLLKRGDCFVIDEPGILLDGVKCIVLSRSYDPKTAQVRIGFRSETDSKHALALGKTTTLPAFPVLTPADPRYVTPPLPGDWTVTPRPPAPGGGGLPSFDLTGVVSNDTATAIIVEYGSTAAGPWTQAYQGPPTVTNIPIEGLQPGATYFIAIQYQRNQNYSERYVYGPYTAPLLDPSPNAPTIQAINADITAAFGDIFDVSALVSQARTDIDAQGAEIAAARGDQPSLNSRIIQVNQALIDGDASNAQAIALVEARTANTEADIIDLESALATETGARAQAIQQVTAKLASRPNIQINGGFENGTAGIGWGGASVVVDDVWGRSVRFIPGGGGTQVMVWPSVSVSPGRFYTFSGDMALFMADGAEPVQSFFAVDGFNGNTPLGAIALTVQGKLIGTHDFDASDARRQAYAISFATPSNCDRIVIKGVVADPVSAINYWSVRQGKLEFGSLPATTYSAEASERQLSASVTEQSLALIDLETQQALARWEVVANASGGKPARIGLTSSSLGSFVALDAPFIFWGDNTVFDDATDTLQTTVGPNIRVLAFGAPFGASGNLLEWWGPSSIAIGSMTTANGLNGRMTTAPYVFDNVVVTVAARFAAGTVTVFRTTSSTTAAQLTSTGTVLVEASVTSTSEDDVTAPIVTADVVGVSSGGVETVLATKSVGSGLPEDPLVYTFAPVQGSYPTYRVKVRGSGPVSKNGQSTVEVTLKTSPVA